MCVRVDCGSLSCLVYPCPWFNRAQYQATQFDLDLVEVPLLLRLAPNIDLSQPFDQSLGKGLILTSFKTEREEPTISRNPSLRETQTANTCAAGNSRGEHLVARMEKLHESARFKGFLSEKVRITSSTCGENVNGVCAGSICVCVCVTVCVCLYFRLYPFTLV